MKIPKDGVIAIIIIVVVSLSTFGIVKAVSNHKKKNPSPITHIKKEKGDMFVELYTNQYGSNIYKYVIEGHDYFAPASGALTHSESCKCRKL